LFLARAQDKFAAYPFMHYALLDIERDGATQGFPSRAFDIIVASNVLHATRNLRKTLEHTSNMLAPGGLLVLCEVTRHPSWFNIISTGLASGWQLFEDDIRGDHPLLTPEQWNQTLSASGFDGAASFPENGSPAGILGQHIIVARQPEDARGSMRMPIEVTALDTAGRHAETIQSTASDDELFLQALRGAPVTRRRDMVADLVCSELALVLRLDPARLDRRRRVLEFGVDSLMAVDFRSRLGTRMALPRALPATLIFDYPTIESIAAYVTSDVLGLDDVAAPDSAAPVASSFEGTMTAADLEQFSDEEVEALLLKKLETL
jgi:hypothetical protein